MEGIPAIYKGKIIPKEGFRTYIYAPDGAKKLVNSWGAYEHHMQTGLWFSKRVSQDVKPVEIKKIRSKKQKIDDDFLSCE